MGKQKNVNEEDLNKNNENTKETVENPEKDEEIENKKETNENLEETVENPEKDEEIENKKETNENPEETVENPEKDEETENKKDTKTSNKIKEYVALTSFVGVISMAKGEKKEIGDKKLVSDLIKAGYIEEVK